MDEGEERREEEGGVERGRGGERERLELFQGNSCLTQTLGGT